MSVSESFSPDYHAFEDSNTGISRPSGSGSSGLKLVLPALKNLKPMKGGKKSKRSGSAAQIEHGFQEEERKVPRPVKLKPLKEVLTKLITQIKKKDDYAFFLKPVDVAQTPGYSDIVKRPMDFGTMTLKVSKGKYRSLEEFASDLRLVTSNAKLFNPPGTIYYTEAEKIEAWGLDHIAKAAPTVIQYETDWNIEIEKDEEGQNINIDDDDDDQNAGTPMDVDEPGLSGRSPSVASEIRPGTQRRGVRGPYKKSTAAATTSNALSESIDSEGRLPGSREGLGAFPPGSDWAKTMVVLKLKGKRYRTKKERMRIEKEGPPLLVDGSLDYTEMEDPFSVLSALAPDPLSRPYLTPLHPPLFRPVDTPYGLSSSQSQPPQPPPPYPTSINLPLDRSFPAISPATSTPSVPKQRRHWVITRNAARSKAKDKDDDQEPPDIPSWKNPREAHPTDFGSFALLAGAIEDEMRRRQVPGYEGEEEEKVLKIIRESFDPEFSTIDATLDYGVGKAEYWSTERAADAEGYIRDIVYGGVAGLAYVRSLAEFTTNEQRQQPGPGSNSGSGLGVPLATWVEKNLVDSLTDGRHALLRETAQELIAQRSSNGQSLGSVKQETQPESVSAQVSKSLYVYPPATVALSALRQIRTHKIDMGALIKTPEELFLSEEEWFGKIFRERRKPRGEEPRKTLEEFEVEEPEKTWMNVDSNSKDARAAGQDSDHELEGPEELNEVLDYVAGVIADLDRTIRDKRPSTTPVTKGTMQEFRGISTSPRALEPDFEKAEDSKSEMADHDGILSASETFEDPVLRNLRLNLLALAKRAPLDTIARLPKDLVPEHIRHFVPTLGASG